MAARFQVSVPAKVGTSPGEVQNFTFKLDDKVSKLIEQILEYNQAKVKGDPYRLSARKYGVCLPGGATLQEAGVLEGDILDLKSTKNCEIVKVFLSVDGNVSYLSVSATSHAVEIDFTDPFRKSTKGIARVLQLESKDDYCFRKLRVGKEGESVEVGRYLNVNLSLKEQSIKEGSYLLLSPVELYFDKPLDQLDFEIRGWMTKNSQKGEKKVTGNKKRYCVLDDNFLFYFANNKPTSKPAGVIDLEYYNASREGSSIRLETAEFAFSNLKIVYTFMCDTEKDANEWFGCLKRHCANGELRRVFGVSLEKSIRDQNEILRVPVKCVNYLDTKLDTPGLFKDGGSQGVIVTFKEKFDKGEVVDLAAIDDPCTVAALLKIYLRELPSPVIPYSAYDKFVAAVNDLDKLVELVVKLPVSHQIVLQILLFFFGRVLDHKAKNGCDMASLCQNMATVFMSKREDVDSMVTDIQKTQAVLKTLIDNRYVLKFKKSGSSKFKMNLKNCVQVRAQYDYTATGTPNSKGEIDMSFKKGDTMKVVEERPGSAWIKAKINKVEGMVPANYVQKFETDDKVFITKVEKEKPEKDKKKISSKGSKRDVNATSDKESKRKNTVRPKDKEEESSESDDDNNNNKKKSSKKEKEDDTEKERKKTIRKEDSRRSTSSLTKEKSSKKEKETSSSDSIPLPPPSSLPLPPVDISSLPPPPDTLLPLPPLDSGEDWKRKYDEERTKREKLEKEVKRLNDLLKKYEQQHGQL